jgi:rhodanese-related sulfurtransferase
MSMTKEAVKDKMKIANVSVVDVLSENDFEKLHIQGSENIPLGSNEDDFIHAVEKRFGKDRFIITYCAGGTHHESANASEALLKRGFKSDNYPGGIREWLEAGFPTGGNDAPVMVKATGKQAKGKPTASKQ